MNAPLSPSPRPVAPPRRRWLRRVALGALAAVGVPLAVFVLWPSPIDARAWQPPPAPPAIGVLAPNAALRDATIVVAEYGSEDLAFDAGGRLYMVEGGTGRIVRLTLDGDGRVAGREPFADTGGNPLDLMFDPNGNLLVSDWVRGLLSISPQGQITTLVPIGATVDGTPFRAPDGQAMGRDGTLYFSQGTDRTDGWGAIPEVLDQRPRGRLLARDPGGALRVLVPELWFGNGVALAPDESFVLVADQYRYRIARHWLAGPKAGSTDFFAENLPGFVHNIRYDGEGTLWAGINQRRNPLVDAAHPYPWLKAQIAKLPPALLGQGRQPTSGPGAGMVLSRSPNEFGQQRSGI